MSDGIGDMIGLGIGLGIGLYALKTIEKLNPELKSEIEKIMSLSTKDSEGYVIVVKRESFEKAKTVIRKSGFKITRTKLDFDRATINYKEK